MSHFLLTIGYNTVSIYSMQNGLLKIFVLMQEIHLVWLILMEHVCCWK